MNNWRLLLLAVVVVVQPIGSFTESNLIDGRECCERSEDARIYGYRNTDERRSLDGNREDRRTTNEERRLKSLQGIREERRYETVRGTMLTRSISSEQSERRNSPELSRFTELRLTREQERRGPLARTRETREDQNRNRDEFRHILGPNKRDPSESKNRDTLDATRTIRVSRNARDTRSVERESRKIMSPLQIRNSRSIEEHRVLPNRDTTILNRAQEGIARRDSRLSDRQGLSSIQLDDNRERRVFGRHTQEDGTESRGSRFSDTRFNRLQVAQIPRTVEQSESNNRDSRVVRVELRRRRRNTELRDRVSAVRRESEKTSVERMRESRKENTRHAQDKIDRNNEINEEHKQQNDENRRSMDNRRNNEERISGSRQTRASRSLDMTRSNEEQMIRRAHSLDRLSMLRKSIRLSRASERNTRSERAASIQVVRDESLDERRKDHVNNRISRDRKTESHRLASRMDISESSEELRRQREIKVTEQSQESRRSATRRDVREPSEDRRQVNRLSKDMTISALRKVRDTVRMLESARTVSTESPEERILQRENSRLSKSKTISILREVRDNTEQESRKRDMDESSDLRQRVNNRLSSNRISMLRADREAHGSIERAQGSRRVVSPSHTKVNFRKLYSRSREVQDRERSDLRRRVLQQSITSTRDTHSISVERRNYARETSRAFRSAEASRIREDTRLNERVDRQQTHDQGRPIGQRVTRKVVTPQQLDSRILSRPEGIRVERVVRNGGHDRTQSFIVQRVTRNVATPQRSDSRRSSRSENTRHVRKRAEIRENQRREIEREERDNDRTRILTNRLSNERVSERRQNRESSKDYREVRMTKNQNAVRIEMILTERRQENRVAEDSRITQGAAMNLAKVRSERVIAERRSENRGSQNAQREIRMDDSHQRDATRDSTKISSHRESRDAIERLNVRSRDSIGLTEARNEREIRKNERQNRFDRNTADTRRESKSVRANKYSTMERTESRIANGQRKETSFKHIDSVAQDTLVQDSDEPVGNWQMVFYMLQGVYLCGLLMQMLTENENKSKKRTFNWWSSPKNLIKVD